VTGHNNIGASFRLCDAFLAERLVICGTVVPLHTLRLVQAAAGTVGWVPWQEETDAATFIRAEGCGVWVADVELTAESNAASVSGGFGPGFGSVRSVEGRACLRGSGGRDTCVGMANSLNISTAGAIVLHKLLWRLRKS
jgi:tRNA G18 (ribose-2'-O)-methylase SpoU